MKFVFGIIFTLFLLISFSSCEEDGPLLNQQDMKMIDTLYHDQIKLREVEMDSLCQLIYDNTFNSSKDSIKTIRLKEIKGILGR